MHALSHKNAALIIYSLIDRTCIVSFAISIVKTIYLIIYL